MRFAPILERQEERRRQRFDRFGNDGQIEPPRQLVDALMPVVRHEAERQTCALALESQNDIAGNLVRIAREDRVVDVRGSTCEKPASTMSFWISIDIREKYLSGSTKDMSASTGQRCATARRCSDAFFVGLAELCDPSPLPVAT